MESNPFLKNIMDQRMEVDANSMDSYPNDVPDVRALYPCRVSSDGNCLPACGSVFAHKTEIYAAEMRLRIIIELDQNENLYLNNDFLKTGLTNTRSKNVLYLCTIFRHVCCRNSSNLKYCEGHLSQRSNENKNRQNLYGHMAITYTCKCA